MGKGRGWAWSWGSRPRSRPSEAPARCSGRRRPRRGRGWSRGGSRAWRLPWWLPAASPPWSPSSATSWRGGSWWCGDAGSARQTRAGPCRPGGRRCPSCCSRLQSPPSPRPPPSQTRTRSSGPRRSPPGACASAHLPRRSCQRNGAGGRIGGCVGRLETRCCTPGGCPRTWRLPTSWKRKAPLYWTSQSLTGPGNRRRLSRERPCPRKAAPRTRWTSSWWCPKISVSTCEGCCRSLAPCPPRGRCSRGEASCRCACSQTLRLWHHSSWSRSRHGPCRHTPDLPRPLRPEALCPRRSDRGGGETGSGRQSVTAWGGSGPRDPRNSNAPAFLSVGPSRSRRTRTPPWRAGGGWAGRRVSWMWRGPSAPSAAAWPAAVGCRCWRCCTTSPALAPGRCRRCHRCRCRRCCPAWAAPRSRVSLFPATRARRRAAAAAVTSCWRLVTPCVRASKGRRWRCRHPEARCRRPRWSGSGWGWPWRGTTIAAGRGCADPARTRNACVSRWRSGCTGRTSQTAAGRSWRRPPPAWTRNPWRTPCRTRRRARTWRPRGRSSASRRWGWPTGSWPPTPQRSCWGPGDGCACAGTGAAPGRTSNGRGWGWRGLGWRRWRLCSRCLSRSGRRPRRRASPRWRCRWWRWAWRSARRSGPPRPETRWTCCWPETRHCILASVIVMVSTALAKSLTFSVNTPNALYTYPSPTVTANTPFTHQWLWREHTTHTSITGTVNTPHISDCRGEDTTHTSTTYGERTMHSHISDCRGEHTTHTSMTYGERTMYSHISDCRGEHTTHIYQWLSRRTHHSHISDCRGEHTTHTSVIVTATAPLTHQWLTVNTPLTHHTG